MKSATPTIEPREDFAAMLTLLQEMNGRLQRIEERLKPRLPSGNDLEILQRLLPPIAAKHGSAAWTAKEITQDPVFRELASGFNVKRLGKLLGRNVGHDVNGLTVETSGPEHSAMLWHVVEVVSVFQTPETPRLSSARSLGVK